MTYKFLSLTLISILFMSDWIYCQDKLVSYSNYDFIPGDQVLFYEDFSQDNPGDIPALWSSNATPQGKAKNRRVEFIKL